MENQQTAAAPAAAPKKKFKIPKWAISLGSLVLVVAIIVSTIAITTAANKNAGVRVLENYITALRRGNVRNFVSSFEARGTDDFDRALDRYRTGVNQFNALSANRETCPVWNREYFDINEYGIRSTMDLGADFYVERIIARSIFDWSYTIVINDPNVIRLRVAFLFDPPLLPADNLIPERYWDYEILTNAQGQRALNATRYVDFRRINNRWVFANGFRLFRRDQFEIETWFNPITIDGIDGYELMNVNRFDIPEDGHFEAIYHNNRPVLSVANRAFSHVAAATAPYLDTELANGVHRMREVTLHGQVRNIGVSAFEGVFDLERVNFSDITEAMTQAVVIQRNRTRPLVVGDAAFRNARSLRSFTLSYVANPVIPSHAFAITITARPQSMITAQPNRRWGLDNFDFRGFSAIGHFAFRGTELGNINLWQASGDGAFDTIRTIGDGAFEFSNVSMLTGEYYGTTPATRINNRLSERVTRIGANAFRNTNISQMALPYHMSSVPFGLVDGNSNFSRFRFSTNLTEIESFAFRGTALPGVNIPGRVEHIGSSAFENTTLLQYVNFAETTVLRSIGINAFSGASSIMSLDLPQTVQSLGEAAFYGTTNLRFVYLNVEPTIGLGARVFSIAQGIPKFYVRPDRQVSQYQGGSWAEISQGWNYQVFCQSIIEDGVAILETGNQVINPLNPSQTRDERVLIQFLHGHLTAEGQVGHVELRDNIRQAANMPRLNITAIAEGAFARDNVVTRVFIDANALTWVGANAFYGADNMLFVEARTSTTSRLRLIGDGTTAMNSTAMWLIDGITIVPAAPPQVPNDVITPGFPDINLDLTEHRHTGVALVNQFNLTNTVGIANSAFEGVATLMNAHLGGVRFIGDSAFAGAGGLINVTFGGIEGMGANGRLLEIGEEAFARTTSLVAVELADTLRSIGARGFYEAPSLRYVIINSPSLSVGENSFVALDNILKVYVANLREGGNIRTAFNTVEWRYFHSFMYDLSIRYVGARRTNYAIVGNTLIQYLGRSAVPELHTHHFERGYTANTGTDRANANLANVNIIGAGAFATIELSSLFIDENIIEIGDNAFFGIENLTYITFTNAQSRALANQRVAPIGQGTSPLRRIGNRAFFETPETGAEGNIIIHHATPYAYFEMGQESFELSARMIRVYQRAPFSGRYIRTVDAGAIDGYAYVREANSGNASWRRYELNYDILAAEDDPSVEVRMVIFEDRFGQGNAGTITAGAYEISGMYDEQGNAQIGRVEGRPRNTTILSAVPQGLNGFAFRGWLIPRDGTNPTHDRWAASLGTEMIGGVEYVRMTDAGANVYRFRNDAGTDQLLALFERIRVAAYVSAGTNSGRAFIFAPSRPGSAAHFNTDFEEGFRRADVGMLPRGTVAPNTPFYRAGTNYGAYFVLTANAFVDGGVPRVNFAGWNIDRVRMGEAGLIVLDPADYGVANYEVFSNPLDFANYLRLVGSGIRTLGTEDAPIIPVIAISEAGVVSSAQLPQMQQLAVGLFLATDATGRIFVINRVGGQITIESEIQSMVRVFINDQDIRASIRWQQ